MVHQQFQNVISRLRMSVNSIFGVVSRSGEIVACSDESQIGKTEYAFRMENDLFCRNGTMYYSLPDSSASRYAVFVRDTGEDASGKAELIASFLSIISEQNSSSQSSAEFLKKMISEQIDPDIVYRRLKELKINNQVSFYAAVIHPRGGYSSNFYHLCDSFFVRKERDYIFPDDSRNIVLVRETGDVSPELFFMERLRQLDTQYAMEASAGISRISNDLIRLPDMYREAVYALHAALTKEKQPSVMEHGHLGYAGLIGKTTEQESRAFLDEAGSGSFMDDEETVFTVRKFLENDLNITETAKELFINRNTLIYRLNRIRKDIGLDPRRFEDAVTLKTILMISSLMKNKE